MIVIPLHNLPVHSKKSPAMLPIFFQFHAFNDQCLHHRPLHARLPTYMLAGTVAIGHYGPRDGVKIE